MFPMAGIIIFTRAFGPSPAQRRRDRVMSNPAERSEQVKPTNWMPSQHTMKSVTNVTRLRSAGFGGAGFFRSYF